MIRTAIAFLSGCLLCYLSNPAYLTMLLYLGMPVLLLAIWRKSFIIISFLLGIFWSGFHIQALWHDQLTPQYQHATKLVVGKVTSVPEIKDNVVRFMFQPKTADLPKQVRLSWHTPPEHLPKAGEIWQLELRLKPPRGTKNPGTFDYEQWLFSRHIGAVGYVKDNSSNKRLQASSPFSVNHWREKIMFQLQQALPDAQFMPLIEGLTIGYTANMTDQHWQTLRLTGTTHLLAISGLHISLSAIVGFFLSRWLWGLSSHLVRLIPAQRAGAVVGMLTALVYSVLAGLSIPTQRSLIMISTVMLALWINRPIYPSYVLAISLLLVLFLDPGSVLNIGFWLSFTAVALIMFVGMHRFPAKKTNWLTIHFWIALGLTPLLIVFFGQTSLISPVANFLAVPFVSFIVVPLVLLAVCFLGTSNTIVSGLLWLSDLLLTGLWIWLEWLETLPLAEWTTPKLPIWLLVMSAITTLLLLLPRGFAGRYWAVLIVPILICYLPARPDSGSFKLSVLDVGQGLSLVIETKQHNLVYDTGASFNDSFDMGQHVVVPFLQARGIRQIDKLIISHSDNDHNGGTQSVLQLMPVNTIFSSDTDIAPSAKLCQAEQSWEWDGVKFEILHPITIDHLSKNDRSCVLKVTGQHYSALLTGDIEGKVERQLLRQIPEKLRSDVLIAPHHGSRTSSSVSFINAVSPDYVVFSVGYQNRYRHPASQIIARYEQRGIQSARTDLHGAVLFDTTGQPQYWRQASQWVWSSKATE